MKKLITSFLVMFIFLSLYSITFGQSGSNSEYEKAKMEYYKQLQKNSMDVSFTQMPTIVDPGANYIQDSQGRLIPAYQTVSNNLTRIGNFKNPPFSTNQPIGHNGMPDAVTGYTFNSYSSTYTAISGGTILASGASIDDNTYAANPIGFTFNFNGVPYTTFGVDANGYVWFGAVTPLAGDRTNVLSSTTASDAFLVAMGYDLYSIATSELRYQMQGVTPNRYLTVQFKNWSSFITTQDTLNFQIILYEGDSLAFMYGANAKDVTARAPQVGLRGATNADWIDRTNTADWITTTAGSTNTTDMIFSTTNYPLSGRTYSFKAPPSSPMGYVSSSVTQVNPGIPYNQNTLNNQIIKVAIVDTGTLSPISITQFKFRTTGSTNPVTDITNAKLYYTGATNTFSATTQYGSTVAGPNGVFYVVGSQSLLGNSTNYFWLTYDLTAGAVFNDTVDAQCDSITGSGTMGMVAPSTPAPAGSNWIDPYCIGTVTNAGCPFGLYIANVNFAGINNTTACNGNLPYVYTSYTNQTATVRQNNPYTISIADLVNPNVTGYGIYIDWNNNNSFGDAGEYFTPPVIPANISTPTSMVITVPAGATIGNHRMRIRCNLGGGPGAAAYCSLLSYGEQEDYTVTVIADTNMTYSSSTTTQAVTSTIFTPSNNTQIIGMQVNVFGTISPLSATSFSLSTLGSTNPAIDITRAKLWYTGTSSTFATTSQYGGSFTSPNGAFVIPGAQQLAPGTNYFWLTYDVPAGATAGDTLDAQCTSITIGGVPRTPTVTAPAGNRIIGGTSLCGSYTIPGSYATIAAAITDLNAKGISCPVVFNVAAGYTETAANLTINTTGTSVNTITFRKSGAGANPLITAGVGTGIYDGVIKFNGVSYITFDGIDVQENVANVTTTTQMEWGYSLMRPDGTHGCQFNTIKNCAITLNKTNTSTYGIYSGVINLTGTAQTVTNVTGGNSNNLFQSVNISNSYSGMFINGYADVSPYSFYDQNNTVTGCNITNFGGLAITVYGMYNYYQNNLVINGNTVNGGTGTTTIMYGIYVGLINNSNLTISNNTVTLTSAYAAGTLYGIYYGAGSAGTSNNINILNNTIQNCDYTSATSAIFYMMYCNAACNNLTISGNRLVGNNYGSVANSSTGNVYFIYSISSIVTSITITNNLDSGNVINGTSAYGVYGIYNGVSTFYTRIANNRIINNQFTGTTAAGTTYGIYNSSGTISCVYDSNTVANNTFPTTSAHTFYNMYNTAASPSMDYSFNTVNGNTSTGSGTFYSMYYGGAPGLGSTVNITNNSILNQNKTTATGTGSIYGIYFGSSPAGTNNILNNTVTGFTSAAATLFAGIYQIGSPANSMNINNNKVGNFTNAGISTIYGIYNNNSAACINQESQDSVFNITSPGSTIYGMYMASGNVWNLSNNRILGLNSNTYTSATVYGIYSAVSNASTINIYNCFISDLTTPASTLTPSVAGIYIPSGVATTVLNIYDNTIYLNATSTSATSFGSAGIYALTTPLVELKNNIIVNKSTPGPTTGFTAAYQRSSITLTTYSANSNNNCFYAGTPGVRNVIYYDGTNSDQTLTTYKVRVNGRDGASVTENPPFVNVATTPYDLRIQTAAPTQLESGGVIISTTSAPPSSVNITTDAFGTARYPNAGYPVGGFTPTAPDIGAHEFGGLNTDIAGPFINYTALGIGAVAATRAFNNVIITDPSGVNVTVGTKPRCYYKRSTDGNVINSNTSADDGWKYVESNGAASPYDFTINYSLLNGGTGVVAGNIINYFVIAQDLVATPNVGWNQGTFTLAPTTVALVTANCPITTTLSYTIGAGGTFSGTINVGTAQTYTNLTGAAGLFQAINAGTVTGNLIIAITSDLVEDGTNGLNATSESGPGGYTIKIVPATGTLKTISGAVANGMIRFNGARRVIVDGNNGFTLDNINKINLRGDNVQTGPSKYLTFRNTNGANPTFTFINEAGRDTLKNCNIESNNTSVASGTILFSTTTNTLGQGNDSISIFQCDIRDRSDAAGTPSNAIYSSGSVTNLATYNNFNSVVNCNIYNNFTDLGSVTAGVYLSTGSSDWTISGNSFYQTVSRAVVNSSTYIGVYSNTSLQNDIIVTNNYFGGTAPNSAGTALTFSGTGLYNYYAIDLIVGGLAASSVQGNTIQNISLTESSASLSTFFRGIFAQTGWVNIGNLAGNTIGSGTGNNSITLTTTVSASSYTLIMIHHTGFGAIMNNTIGSITIAGSSTGTAELYAGIYWINALAGQTLTISNNLIGSFTTANSIQCTNVLNAAAIRGVYIQNGAGTTTNITNNVVANLTSFSTTSNGLSSVYGIQQNNAVLANNNITGNTVRNLSANTNYNLGASFTVLGIGCPALGLNNVSQNTIASLYVNAVGTGTPLVGGILAGGASTGALGGTVIQNKMYDFRLSTTGVLAPAPLLLGINVQGNCPYTITNNMISITNGDATDNKMNINPPDNYRQVVVKNPPVNLNAIPKNLDAVKTIVVAGDIAPGLSADRNYRPDNLISKNKDKNPKTDNVTSTNSTSIAGVYMTSASTGACNYYYNSIYIGGTQPGGFNSWAFVRTGLAPVNLRNNLLVNVRTGGTCYVIGNEAATINQGWPATASNYNVFIGSNAATIGEWTTGNSQALPQWTASSGGDNQTFTTTSAGFIVQNLLTNVTVGDLSIRNFALEAWLVSGKGIAISSVNNDYQGDARVTAVSGGCTDVGADEFTQTPPSNLAATQVGTPGPGATTNYVLYGRTICSVDWGTGGTSYPSALTINYMSGLNPPTGITTPTRNSNSYWTVVPTGTLTGAKYDITFFFGDNETYTISSPSTNTLLARNNTFWQVYSPGTGNQQNDVNWSLLSAKVRGLTGFSTYALSDAAFPTPNLLTPVDGAINQPASLNLVWNKSAAATTYRVQLAIDSLFGTIIKDSTLTDSIKTVSGLTDNTNYWWRVDGTNGIGTGAWTQVFKFHTNFGPPPPAIVNMNVIPGGFYNTSTGQLNMRDTLRILLIDSATCNRLDSCKRVVDSVTFGFQASFGIAPTGNYYIMVFHRNHLPISSRLRQTVTRGSTVAYDFTNDSTKTYGNNVTRVAVGKYGMIPGDANADQFVDGLDQTIWYAQNGFDGYLSADFNGDGFVDGLDQTIWILFNGNSSFLPCGITVPDLLRWEKEQINHKTVGNIKINPINTNVTNKNK